MVGFWTSSFRGRLSPVQPWRAGGVLPSYPLCDDITRFVQQMGLMNVKCSAIREQSWRLLSTLSKRSMNRLAEPVASDQFVGAEILTARGRIAENIPAQTQKAWKPCNPGNSERPLAESREGNAIWGEMQIQIVQRNSRNRPRHEECGTGKPKRESSLATPKGLHE